MIKATNSDKLDNHAEHISTKTHSWPADEGIESWSINWKDKSNNKMYLKRNEKRPNAQEESADPKTNPETIEERIHGM